VNLDCRNYVRLNATAQVRLDPLLFGSESVVFHVVTAAEAATRVDPQEREWINNPEGVQVFSGEMADQRTYEDKPFSTKVGAAVAGKVRQCAEGACNIVVLGTPSPMVDHDVDDAVHGAMAAAYIKADNGSFESAGAVRKPSAIFVPAAKSENADNLVYPYRKISGVWHIKAWRFKSVEPYLSEPERFRARRQFRFKSACGGAASRLITASIHLSTYRGTSAERSR
jgi:hypothetical protein